MTGGAKAFAAGVLALSLCGCSSFGLGFLRGVAGDASTEATISEEEKAGQLVGEGTKEVVETLPFGKVATGLIALLVAGYAIKKKKGD